MFRLSGLVLALAVGLVAVGVAQAQTLTTLASFNDSDGQCPFAGVTLSADGSTLYGTTFYGGANYDGDGLQPPGERWQPDGARLVQRRQWLRTRSRPDAQRQHPVRYGL